MTHISVTTPSGKKNIPICSDGCAENYYKNNKEKNKKFFTPPKNTEQSLHSTLFGN